MSQANVEVVKRLFESYRRGDYAQAAACLAPDVVYEVGQELPARGRAEVRAVWERWDGTWDELDTVPEEFTDAGDQVLSPSATRRADGAAESSTRSVYSTSTRLAMASASANASSESDPRPSRRQDSISTRRQSRNTAAPLS
jgi:ketosteroid isomerase-like protein